MPKKRGRPAFKPTPAIRRKVAIAAGAGMRHQDIAIGLGISDDTLRKYFDHELSEGALAKRMEVVEAMRKAAIKGSSSAARLYLALEPELTAPPVPVEADVKPEKPKGKKAAAEAEAPNAHIGTDWDKLLPSSTTRQ